MRRSTILVMSLCLCACTPATVKVWPSTAPIAGDGSIVVLAGDSLYGIASRNGVNVVDLAQANGIVEPFTIHPGDRLRLPARASAKPATAAAPAATATPSVFVDVLPESAPAPAPKPAAAKPGATATKPVPTKAAPTATSAKPAAATAKATTPKTTTAKVTTIAATAATPPIATHPPQAAPANSQWQWPANGSLVNLPARSDALVYALDIAGTAGNSVRAAAEGKVLYSGEGSPGYEQLIVIEHAGGWVSSYSHNRKRLVREGQTVAKGTAIAEMGHVGASRDMLHFELRRGGQLIDPRTVLPPR